MGADLHMWNLYEGRDVIAEQLRIARECLESIAKNTCCDKCQEASLVAKKALEDMFKADPRNYW